MRRLEAAVVLSSLLAIADVAAAQNAPPYDPAIDLQLFEYAVGPKTFFAVADADVAPRQQLSFDVFLTFLTNPFVVYEVAPGEESLGGARARVVRSLATAELSGAYGLTDRLQLGVTLPIVSMTGDGLDPETAMALPGGLAETGLGDLRLEVKARLLRRGTLRVAGLLGASLPTSFGSGGSAFLGDDLPALRGRLAVQFTAGRLALGANAGLVLRKSREIYATEVGPQATWAGAAALRLTERFFVVGEAFGRTGLSAAGLDGSPMEVGGGLRVFVTSSLALVAGGGAGVVSGIGSPDLRVFTSLGYSPDVRDSDGDGIVNGRDTCPTEPEDKDAWQDLDGCPEDDNDGDRVRDAQDKCPGQAEDLDGFDDDDGCPELDNDGDGIADLQDKCPEFVEDKVGAFAADGCPITKHDADGDGLVDAIDQCQTDAEDIDEFEDGDGCPDADQDHDGVDDTEDQCPVCAEDRDTFEDADGCPELDNDRDGLRDAEDRCPTEAETLNAVDDFDGCPDEGGITIATFDGERILMERAPPFDRKGLTRAGELIVDQMALLMLAHPEVTRWLVALADPKARYAGRRAEQVKAQLARRGVTESSLEVMSATGGAKLVAVAKDRLDADAPRVCPTPIVTPRPERAVAPTLPSSPATPTQAAPTSARPAPTSATPAPAASATPTPAPAPAAPTPAAPAGARAAPAAPSGPPATKPPVASSAPAI
ncbi:MAG: thrombospondin type 3 repeat-containing protein [Myxococcales bacterium]|nr:thrombospondin type 3 repeat-containing protein [Myxococcales bacterium]